MPLSLVHFSKLIRNWQNIFLIISTVLSLLGLHLDNPQLLEQLKLYMVNLLSLALHFLKILLVSLHDFIIHAPHVFSFLFDRLSFYLILSGNDLIGLFALDDV
jgi:hypothetical protein